VFTDFSSGQHGEIFLRQDEVLWLLDSLAPQFQKLLPFFCQLPLATRTPLDGAAIFEPLDRAAAFARPEKIFRTASAEIPKLRSVP
jgi:hypothetical protein